MHKCSHGGDLVLKHNNKMYDDDSKSIHMMKYDSIYLYNRSLVW